MAALAHLEKMGRELKCPICLGLLKSAVSLTCNHFFCDLCIKKTMKLDSHCPICKVPFGRREVRSAPNMDNLVSIYKSMEVASGINTLASQTTPPADGSDGIVCAQNKPQYASHSDSPQTRGKGKRKRKFKGKTSKNCDTVENVSQPSQEPTFPAKKRVQVPQCLLSDTPMRSENFAVGRLDEISEDGPGSSLFKSKGKSFSNDKGEPAFAPFFWLREDNPDDDVEKPSGQLMTSDDSKDTPRKIPSFSDLKDSDDESPTKSIGNGEEKTESKIPDLFDSEMFEWTQRPCSPELFSTPEKTKAGYKELNTIEDAECVVASPTQGAPTGEAVSSEIVKAVNCEQANENIDEKLAPVKAKSSKNRNKSKKSKRKSKRNTGIAKEKCAKISTDEVLGDVCIDLGEVGEVSNQSVQCATNSTATNVRNKICSKNKKARFNGFDADKVTDELHEAIEANSENHATKETATRSPTSLDGQHTKSIHKNSEKINKLDIQLKRTNARSLKDKTVAAAAVEVVEEVQKNENQENGKANTKSPAQTDLQVDPPRTSELEERARNKPRNAKILGKRNCAREFGNQKRLDFTDDSVKGVSVGEVAVASSKVVDPSKTSELEKRTTDKHRDTKILGDKSCMQELREGKRVKFSTDNCVKTGSVGKVLDESNKAVAKENQTSKQLQENSDNSSRTKKVLSASKAMLLQKCENVPVKIQELREGKRVKFSTGNCVKTGSVGKVLDESNKAVAKENQTCKQLQESSDNSSRTKKVLSASKAMLLQKCDNVPVKIQCAFCQSSTESEASGKMLHYVNGKPVADYNKGSHVIHSHSNCTEWAPNVYFEKDTAVNLGTEVARSKRIKCSCCGIKGASLGCYENSCRKSFHVPCAKMVPQCRWDTENFVLLCPIHSSSKLPNEVAGSVGQRRKKSIPKTGETEVREAEVVVQDGLNISQAWNSLGSSKKWVLCCSGLTDAEKEIVSEFTRITGIPVSKTFGTNVTHIIASTDTSGACKRTLKFLLGILDGKWILNIDWVKACLQAMEPVAEEQYEVKVDIHGIEDGPRLGRLRVQKKQPKLFSGLNFYFFGEFVPSYKGDLQNLVVAAGGTVLHRKPIKGDLGLSLSDSSTSTFIIYSLDVPDECDPRRKSTICNRRKDEARALAGSSGTKFAGHPWLLDSIAACKLQPLT
ncbi:hypothetical protein MKW98_032237 [Papaver atlanticum]|uniref:Uncharacterized protein n=1 Tax=Papaver atlanticum TaxID=357466 RepID=A0AAD4SEI7_9MAGN|nr:hypothetical protein MKW98_032237 [Papaver atlanticum]